MQGTNVVHVLLRRLENIGQIMIMNKFFLSVPLFMDILDKDTYATCTIRANRIGLLTALAKKYFYTKCIQGHLEWRMYKAKQLTAIVWVDQKSVFVMSMVTPPIHKAGEK